MNTKEDKQEQIDVKASYAPEQAASLLKMDTDTLTSYVERKLLPTDERGRVPGYALLRLKAGVLAHFQSNLEYKVDSPAFETKGNENAER